MYKRIGILILIGFICFFLFSGNSKENVISEDRGVFISYIEIEEYLKNKDETDGKKAIDLMIDHIRSIGGNMIVLQVRPCSDAIYYSNIFPFSRYLTDSTYSFDVLEYFIEQCHFYHMKLIAWINPYRVQTSDDLSFITSDHPAYPYLNTDVLYVNHGVYYNPAREEVEQLILDGVLEVLEYDVDGILFDDYFYPSSDIDKIEYEEYKKHHFITLEEYHLMIINQMILNVHSICSKKNVSFGISPDGNIQNNYQIHYADVKTWMSSNQYIDFIMPQLYYGFYNQTKPFLDTSMEWEKMLLNDSISFYVALAFYKVGMNDKYAMSGQYEWIENHNIILREIIASRHLKNYKGFILFRYDNLFREENFTLNSQLELDNMKKVLK